MEKKELEKGKEETEEIEVDEELSLEELAEEIKKSLVSDEDSLQHNFDLGIESFLHDISDSSPVLNQVARGTGRSGLEGAFSGFENIQTGGEDEDGGGVKYAGATKYVAGEEKVYDEAPKTDMEINTFNPASVDIMEIGRDVQHPEMRGVGFVSSERGGERNSNSLDQNYLSAEKVDMMEVGKERESLAKREYKVK